MFISSLGACSFLLCMMMTTISVTEASEDMCALIEDGCSGKMPKGISKSFKKFLMPLCNQHDVCYACGATREKTQEVCDMDFWDGVKNVCDRLMKRPVNAMTLAFCERVSDDLPYTIRSINRQSYPYQEKPEEYCHECF